MHRQMQKKNVPWPQLSSEDVTANHYWSASLAVGSSAERRRGGNGPDETIGWSSKTGLPPSNALLLTHMADRKS